MTIPMHAENPQAGVQAPSQAAGVVQPSAVRDRGKFSRLFIKYVALFVAVVGVALLSNGIFEVIFYYREHKAALIRVQHEQAVAAAAKISQFIKEIESQLGWTTQLPWSTGSIEQRRFDALRLLRQVPAITELAQVDSSGRERLRVSRLAMDVLDSGIDLSKEAKFTETIAHKVYYGPVYFRRESEPYMTLAIAGTRKDAGVSIAEVNLKLIWDVVSQIRVGEHGEAYVVGAQGRLIAHPDISLVLRNTDMSKLRQVALAQASGGVFDDVEGAKNIQGQEVLTASAPISPLPWTMFVELPVDEAYASLYRAMQRLAIVLLAASILAVLAGIFLARRMVGPIQALRAGAARIGGGDFTQRISIKTGDELEGLANQFNDMGARLQESYADLEKKVESRTAQLKEALQQQTATSEVLEIISSSKGQLAPVFDKMLENATRICGANFGTLTLYEDGGFRTVALYNVPKAYIDTQLHQLIRPHPESGLGTVERTHRTVHIDDIRTQPPYIEGNPNVRALADLAGARTLVIVPMLKEDELIGSITIFRQEVKPFTDKQTELVANFANQAVIAIENVRLLNETQEALQHQTGSANILRVIASSPTDVGPVLHAIVESACALCEAYDAVVMLEASDELRLGAHHGPLPMSQRSWPNDRTSISGRAMADQRPVHVVDVLSDESTEFAVAREMSRTDGCHTLLGAPLLREGESIGAIVLRRAEPHPFSAKQIALLQTFADQAVIAIANVQLFEEVQAKTRDLEESLQQQTATADVLKVISRSPDKLNPVLSVIVETSRDLCNALTAVIFLLRDGKFHVAAESSTRPKYIEAIRAKPISLDQKGSIMARAAREKRTVHVPNSADDPEAGRGGPLDFAGPRSLLSVPLMLDGRVIGGITLQHAGLAPFTPRQIEAVETFADQAVIAISNVNLFEQVQQRTRELSQSLDELRTAQDRLIQTEKLASLGQLTAGIAHEIKNPLNFVNNFSTLSVELIDELNVELSAIGLDDKAREQIDELTQTLKGNLERVVQHGKRADSIIRNMLLHSREGSGEHRPTDINAMVEESLNLAYHGARAEKSGFNVTLKRSLDPDAGMADLYPQEITRVLLNLISNGFYAATKRKEAGKDDFEPTLSASTRSLGNQVEIRIRDNGTGIPPEVREKIFNPFFTTKPAGEGTGLGLSMSHDIVVKQHGGKIDLDTKPGAFTEFIITLPRNFAAQPIAGGGI